MITLYKYNELGQADYGWLNAKYHFNFAQYYNPKRNGFGTLRVINHDIVAPNKGFDLHFHKNMEIITYVKKGAITHRDSIGNQGKLESGQIQVMSAGKGIKHSEYNNESHDTELYQIWIEPSVLNISPLWTAMNVPTEAAVNSLQTLVSGMDIHKENNCLNINQDAAIYGGHLFAGIKLIQKIVHQAYIIVISGKIIINDIQMQEGDGAEVVNIKEINITAISDSSLLIIDAPI